MVKSSKKSKAAATSDGIPAASGVAASNPPATDKPAKSAKAAAPSKSAGKRAQSTSGKARTARKPQTATRKAGKAGQFAISDEDIRLRAYFISEKRMQNGLPGDSAHDWLEAHRQLQEEAGKSA